MGTGGNKRKTGSRRGKWIFIGAWVPTSMAAAVDEAVQSSNLNRSKFLRLALEEKVRQESK
jgi:Ribbon-helix-helix protein, copG family